MADTTDFDAIVLGLGPGGEDVAGALAEAGWSVLGLDPRLVGGECPYFGCVPSKMIIRGADVLGEARRVDRIAGHATVEPDFAPVARRIRDEATDNWDDQVAVDRFVGKGGTFVRAKAQVAGREDDGRILVEADGATYRSAIVIVATGTAPALPPIDGLAAVRDLDPTVTGRVWTNREVVRTTEVPARLTVIGGGAIGAELAQAFSRYGSAVTLLEVADRILALEEPEASEVVTGVMRSEGMDVRTAVRIDRVTATADAVQVVLSGGETIDADRLLIAAGRRPNLDIGLSSLGLDDSARTLPVDDHLRALHDNQPVDGLYAIGDITGRGAFTHVSVWQARALAADLLNRPRYYDGYRGLAWATFTDPEVGRVGLTEKQARDQGVDVQIGSTTIASSSRGWIHGPGNDGIIKLVEDRARGVLVGATVVSPYGGEILGLLTLAVHAQVPLDTLLSMHYAYPTLHRAVLDALTDLITH